MGPTENTEKLKLPWVKVCLLKQQSYRILKNLACKFAISIHGPRDTQENSDKFTSEVT